MTPSPLTPDEQALVDSAKKLPLGISIIPPAEMQVNMSPALQEAYLQAEQERKNQSPLTSPAGGIGDFFNGKASLPQAAGNALGGLVDKVQEGWTDLKAKFSGKGPFDKLGAKTETVEEAAAKHAFAKAEVERAAGDDRVKAMEEESRLSAEDVMTHNDVTDDAATKMVQDQVDADVSAAELAAATKTTTTEADDHKIRLTEKGGGFVMFDIMPEIYETRSVEYEAIAPPQSPAAFQKYKGTGSTQWTINATLVCRTNDEATTNLQVLNILRGWTMPFFGQNTATHFNWGQKIGAPPSVLTLSGWRKGVVGPTPVVITGLNWTFPVDVDYLPALAFDGTLVPFPTVLKVAINCVETYSTDQMNGFDRFKMMIGDIEGTWAALASGAQLAQAQTSSATPQAQSIAGSGTPVPADPGVISEPPTAMDGEGGRLPIGSPSTEGNSTDLGLG
jgi:hypothetical protein